MKTAHWNPSIGITRFRTDHRDILEQTKTSLDWTEVRTIFCQDLRHVVGDVTLLSHGFYRNTMGGTNVWNFLDAPTLMPQRELFFQSYGGNITTKVTRTMS